MKYLKFILSFPFGLCLFLMLSVLVTVTLIPIFAICYLFNLCINRKTNIFISEFEEFIALCYGFAMLFMAIPFGFLDEE